MNIKKYFWVFCAWFIGLWINWFIRLWNSRLHNAYRYCMNKACNPKNNHCMWEALGFYDAYWYWAHCKQNHEPDANWLDNDEPCPYCGKPVITYGFGILKD